MKRGNICLKKFPIKKCNKMREKNAIKVTKTCAAIDTINNSNNNNNYK